MSEFFCAWAAILVTWTFLAVAYCGLGLFIVGAFGVPLTIERLVAAVWHGYCVTIALLQFWHFFSPVHWSFSLVLAVLALAGWILTSSQVRRFVADLELRTVVGWGALTFLVTAWVANRAMGPNLEIDSHLYHIPTMLWYKQFSIVPGLGNLYLPLASNSSSLLVAAWLDSGAWSTRAHHVVNGFLIAALIWHALSGVASLRRPSAVRRAVGLFKLLALVPAIQMSNHWMVSGFSTDVAPAALVLVASADIFALLLVGRSTESCDRNAEHPHVIAVNVTVLLAAAICCKLSAFAFSLIGVLLSAGALVRCGRKRATAVWAPILAGLAIWLLFLMPWGARGIVLSGYPLYPSTTPKVDVDWRIPQHLVENERFYQMVRNRLRHFYDWGNEEAIASLAGWGWLRYWARLLEREVIVPAALIVLSLMAIVVCRAGNHRSAQVVGEHWRGWFVCVPALGAIVFWMLTQATQRMGFFLVWVCASAAVAIVGGLVLRLFPRLDYRHLLLTVAVLAAANLKKTHTAPGDDGGLHQGMATPPMVGFETDWGLRVLRPAVGDCMLCSSAPPPATPTPRRDLRLRRPGDLASGFRLERRRDRLHASRSP